MGRQTPHHSGGHVRYVPPSEVVRFSPGSLEVLLLYATRYLPSDCSLHYIVLSSNLTISRMANMALT